MFSVRFVNVKIGSLAGIIGLTEDNGRACREVIQYHIIPLNDGIHNKLKVDVKPSCDKNGQINFLYVEGNNNFVRVEDDIYTIDIYFNSYYHETWREIDNTVLCCDISIRR